MFSSSLPPVVCRRAQILLVFLCVCLRIVMSNTFYYQMSLRFEFRVVISATISAWERYSVRLYLQLFVGWIISYLRYFCLFVYGGVQHILGFAICFVCLRLVHNVCQFCGLFKTILHNTTFPFLLLIQNKYYMKK